MRQPFDDLPTKRAEYLRQSLRDLAFMVPTAPGWYVDSTGSHWELRSDGQWFDKNGETKPVDWNYVLAIFAPWTRIFPDRK